jgi:hypothetical protein
LGDRRHLTARRRRRRRRRRGGRSGKLGGEKRETKTKNLQKT